MAKFQVTQMRAIWVREFYEVEVATRSEDDINRREEAEAAFLDDDYEYLGHELRDSVSSLDPGVESIVESDERPVIHCDSDMEREAFSNGAREILACIDRCGMPGPLAGNSDFDVLVSIPAVLIRRLRQSLLLET